MSQVSIVLPTYNRARFLPQAFEALREQTFTDWNLIIIDDGSTDETTEVLERLRPTVTQEVTYIRQANAGAAGARNTGIDVAKAPFVAFLDSDDHWLPHHLSDSVAELRANPDVDLVVGALRRVEMTTGHVVEENTFHPQGKPHPLLLLRHQVRGQLRVPDDSNLLETVILHGGVGVLQNTVYRRNIFDGLRLRPYLVGEDRFFGVELLTRGHKPAFLDAVHVQYNIHNEGHISAAAGGGSIEKRAGVILELLRCYEDMRRQLPLPASAQRAVRKRLALEAFWHLGYGVYWTEGRIQEALDAYRRGLASWPWDISCWKTYILAQLRAPFRKPA